MTGSVAELLDKLGRNQNPGLKELPAWAEGTIRLDIQDDGKVEQWFITLKKGKAQVSTTGGEVKAVLCGDRSVLDLMARGETKFSPAVFRADLIVEGDLRLADAFGRILFPGPPMAHHPRDFVRKEGAKRDRENREHSGR
ncbi:SCP2 sterol-binding domain-containing protein [Micromonospora sp. KC721]|uniref:SCP2 sterol-binding domain-containing protein n=1 Tax=Micromonospora sp. KC721 TaxID=2530380 RepID=UPI001051E357|nr:SCP2 sterol-binding domain-containing protein [Micromonospora sp. KC721]TDB78810.1 sterol-binding protein [Micromonospora sp. KC721]